MELLGWFFATLGAMIIGYGIPKLLWEAKKGRTKYVAAGILLVICLGTVIFGGFFGPLFLGILALQVICIIVYILMRGD